MFLPSTSFSVKLQPIIDLRPTSLLDKEWQRYLAETFLNFYKGHLAETTSGNLCGGAQNIGFWNIFWIESLANSGYSRIAVCTDFQIY